MITRSTKAAELSSAFSNTEDGKSTSTPTTPSLANTTSLEDRCVCNWNDCRYMRHILKEHNHPLGGDCIRMRFSNTCSFQNLWGNACINLHIPSKEKFTTERKFAEGQEDVRISIARHHWPTKLIQMTEKKHDRFTTPLDPEEVEKHELLPDIYRTDNKFKYNPNLGSKRHPTWQKQHPTMYIRSPCQTHIAVKAIVHSLMSNGRRRTLA